MLSALTGTMDIPVVFTHLISFEVFVPVPCARMHNIDQDLSFMKLAFAEAEKAYHLEEVPIGAILTHNDEILSTGHNLRETTKNPLDHAEILTLQKAASDLQTWKLEETTLYVTVEPCIMCAGAILQSRIQRVVYGCHDPKAGAVFSLYQLFDDKRLNHRVEVTFGILETPCKVIIQNFFRNLRYKNNMERCPSG